MTPILCCGFECGVTGTGLHWAASGSPSFSTSTVRNGSRAGRVNPTAATQGFTNSTGANVAINVFRFAVRFATLPAADMPLGTALTGSNHAGAFFKQSDSKIYAGSRVAGVIALGATGVAVTTDVWYVIDVKSNMTNNPWLIDVNVNGEACGQRSTATAGATTGTLCLADINVNQTTDVFFDDVLWSQTSADYPIGDGFVNHFVPTADGTHNIAGTGDFQRTLTGTDILNATTTAFQLVDEVPLEATVTDWINMLAPPNATDYVECIFGPAPGILTPMVGPRAVDVICGINQSGTGAGNIEIRLNDNGTTNVVHSATGVAGVAVATGQVFKRKHYATAPTGGAWNANNDGGNGDFRDLRIRFGSPAALDVNPDQYFGCALIEAEFAPELDRSMYTRPFGVTGQAQMNQLLAT